MMPCITVVPRLRTVAVAFVPSGVSHDHSWVGETRSVPCPVPVRSRPELPRESDVFLVGLRHPTDDAAQVGRAPVAFTRVSTAEDFGFAGGHSSSPSQTIR